MFFSDYPEKPSFTWKYKRYMSPIARAADLGDYHVCVSIVSKAGLVGPPPPPQCFSPS
jgi:hypothetical protein